MGYERLLRLWSTKAVSGKRKQPINYICRTHVIIPFYGYHNILKEYETDPPGKCCHGRDRNNICQEDFSMEILETEERKMNKNTEKKQELTHFLEHYWIYAIILVIILLHFLKDILR